MLQVNLLRSRWLHLIVVGMAVLLWGGGVSAQTNVNAGGTGNTSQPGLEETPFVNAFTPNGDGLNDEFHPAPRLFKNYTLVVYNRWGKKVFEGNNEKWNGGNAAEGVYVYRIKGTTVKGAEFETTATVTLLR